MSFRDDILKRLESDRNLPSLPDVVMRLSKMVADPDASAAEVAGVIKLDPALSGRILRLANSAAMGGMVQVSSIPQAVMRIGLKGIRDIVLAISMIKIFPKTPFLDLKRFWKHSLSVAYACEIMEHRGANIHKMPDESFSAGLLHDLGILILDQFAGDLYRKVVGFAMGETRELQDAEREILGIDHTETGAMLLKRWNLPAVVTESALYHHDPCIAPSGGLLAKIVHMANFACNNQGIDNGAGSFSTHFSEAAWFDTGLSVEEIPTIIEEVNQRTARADEILSVV